MDAFLTLAMDEGEWLSSLCTCFSYRKATLVVSYCFVTAGISQASSVSILTNPRNGQQ
jgi:hypothetical protein